ncbi:hypothetical protein O6H91_02G004700 [Diphasiastrum complanatum]|uniref:Uncharacterized protein n=1 Tax=Diphasiastrum complanatum TaxID=34168 RepID=A0ACC2EC25_DIPCM|nr:hypothetical protein O6H91_02G004700 [Diphasiastrum complanatum]
MASDVPAYLKASELLKACWITSGPTLVAFGGQRLLIAYPLHISKGQHSSERWIDPRYLECQWEVYVLNLSNNKEDHVKVLFCGERRSGVGPEVIIGLSNASFNQLETQSSKRPSPYIRLDLLSLPWSIYDNEPVEVESLNIGSSLWQQSSSDTVSRLGIGFFPADLDPYVVSCSELIPAVSSMGTDSSSDLPPRDALVPEVSHDLVIGTTDKRLIRCKNGEVTVVIDLEDVPSSLHFAVMAGGQGVLFVKSNSMEGRVVAMCLETHRRLQVWMGIENIGIGDYQMIGHEQVALLQKQNTSCGFHHSTPSLCPVDLVITDLRQCILLESNTEKAAEEQRIINMKAMRRELETRNVAGVSQLKNAEKEREKKAELLLSSCQLMQTIAGQHGLPKQMARALQIDAYMLTKTQNSSISLVQAKGVYTMVCGRMLTVMIHVQSIAPRNLSLNNVSLMLTTLQGQLHGMSSSLKLLLPDDGVKRLIVAVPLSIAMFKNQIINVVLTAVVSFTEEHKAHASRACNLHFSVKDQHSSQGVVAKESDYGTLQWNFMQWIFTVQLNESALCGNCEPELSPLSKREVCDWRQLWVTNIEEKCAYLPEIIKGALKMFDRPGYQNADYPVRAKELVSRGLFAWADATVLCLQNVSMITLRAEASEDLELMLHLLITHLKAHHFKLLPPLSSPDVLKCVGQVVHALLKEIASILSLINIKESGAMQHSDRVCPFTVSSNLKKAQILTDQLLIMLLSFNN